MSDHPAGRATHHLRGRLDRDDEPITLITVNGDHMQAPVSSSSSPITSHDSTRYSQIGPSLA